MKISSKIINIRLLSVFYPVKSLDTVRKGSGRQVLSQALPFWGSISNLA